MDSLTALAYRRTQFQGALSQAYGNLSRKCNGKIGQHNPKIFAMNGYLIYEIA